MSYTLTQKIQFLEINCLHTDTAASLGLPKNGSFQLILMATHRTSIYIAKTPIRAEHCWLHPIYWPKVSSSIRLEGQRGGASDIVGPILRGWFNRRTVICGTKTPVLRGQTSGMGVDALFLAALLEGAAFLC